MFLIDLHYIAAAFKLNLPTPPIYVILHPPPVPSSHPWHMDNIEPFKRVKIWGGRKLYASHLFTERVTLPHSNFKQQDHRERLTGNLLSDHFSSLPVRSNSATSKSVVVDPCHEYRFVVENRIIPVNQSKLHHHRHP